MANSVETSTGDSPAESLPTPEERLSELKPPSEPPPSTDAREASNPTAATTPLVEASGAPVPPPESTDKKSPASKPEKDDTEAKLEKADRDMDARKKATERAERLAADKADIEAQIANGKAKGLETGSLENWLKIVDARIEAHKASEPVVVEADPVKTLTPEEIKEEIKESRARLKKLEKAEKPLLEDEVVSSSRKGELKFDPDVVKTHIDRWHEAEYLAVLGAEVEGKAGFGDPVGVKLSLPEIDAMVTYLKDQKPDDPTEKARIKDDLRRLGEYRKSVFKGWDPKTPGAEPPTMKQMDDLEKKGQLWNDIKIEVPVVDTKEPTPPGPPNPPGPPTPPGPPEPTPVPPEPTPNPIEPTPEPTPNPNDVESAKAEYDLAVERWAKARIESEKLSPLKRKEKQAELDAAREELNQKFEAYARAMAQEHMRNNTKFLKFGQESVANTQTSKDREANLRAQKALPDANRDPEFQGMTDAQFDAYIDRQVQYQADQEAYRADLLVKAKAEHQAEFDRQKASMLMEVRKKVDDAMIAERLSKQPKLLREFNEFLKRHPKGRLYAGLALTGIGVVGTATGLWPLAGVAFAGRAALAGVGAYNASRGAGEMIGNKQLGENNKSSLDEELGVQEKQTKTRKWSKRVGVLAGAGATAISIWGIPGFDGPGGPDGPRSSGARFDSVNNPELLEQARAGGLRGPRLENAIENLRSSVRPDQLPKVDALIANEGIYGPHVQLLAGMSDGIQPGLALPQFDQWMAYAAAQG